MLTESIPTDPNHEPDRRIERGRMLADAPGSVLPMADGGYWVASSQQDGTGYIVSADLTTCTCPDHRHRERTCKHLLAARFVAERERLERERRLPTCRECRQPMATTTRTGYCPSCLKAVLFSD